MDTLLHQLIEDSAQQHPDREALRHGRTRLCYAELQQAVDRAAAGLQACGLNPGDRIAIFLPKQMESVVALFAAARAGGIFVPVNPLLKPQQVAHILNDSGASLLITSPDRARWLQEVIGESKTLNHLVLMADQQMAPATVETLSWEQLLANGEAPRPMISASVHDSVAILYTSGSTGQPKGVELTHSNLVLGAQSVAGYLGYSPEDRILAVLPFSFDYGLSQLTTAFYTGASVVLLDYLLPREVINTVVREKVTGLAGVPTLWTQLAGLDWPGEAQDTLRFITNSGGAMPSPIIDTMRKKLPRTEIYLMYGLTEAFRSTYLHPREIHRRPGSIGKAIPHAQISVLGEDGRPCLPGEPGELVHSGPLVARGYWNNPQASAERFRPLHNTPVVTGQATDVIQEAAVWSGDIVSMDEEGYLYFLGRRDDQIKTSGYRVSPTEIEQELYATGQVPEAAVIGLPHPSLGQAIVAFVTSQTDTSGKLVADLIAHCKKALPGYMVPQQIILLRSLPKTPHGKIDRQRLAEEFRTWQAVHATSATP